MRRIAFCDESGTQGGNRCYGIGSFVVAYDELPVLERQMRDILSEHGITHELKWNGIRAFRPDIEAACAGVNLLLNSGNAFHSIVVEKATFVKFRGNSEEAFYMTYQYLATDIARSISDPFECWIDARSDSYARRPEVMRKITNYRTAREPGTGELVDVKMVDSKFFPIVQMVDVLIGAVTADTHRYLTNGERLNEGKEEVIRRLASTVGWDRLAYDSFPNPYFNVWHFPIQFRGRPGSRAILPPSARLQAVVTRS